MKWTGKVVGAAVGLLTGGPIGAALGVLLGHQVDAHLGTGMAKASPGKRSQGGPSVTAIGESFFRSTFRVMGHLAKADGRVSEREIAAARSIMSDLRLNSAQVGMAVNYFTEGKQRQFNLPAELAALARACNGRPELARVFLEIQVRAALAGNNMEGPIRELLQRIATRLDISTLEFAHIESVLRIRNAQSQRGGQNRSNGAGSSSSAGVHAFSSLEEVNAAYAILETSSTAANEDVVKAYRRQLSKHHPDKLKANGLPESMIEHAKQRTQQIIEAYEMIKERRGL
ncbi:MAG TPA: co-chaperone DjlA [Steroidobacteraceae bacterium]|jgi:DnaJ like chaperone protein